MTYEGVGRDVRSKLSLVLLSVALLAACTAGGSGQQPQVLQVRGFVEQPLSAEDFGGTPLTTLRLLQQSFEEPHKVDDYLRRHLGESCGFGSRFTGAEVLVKGPDGAVLALGHTAQTAVVAPDGPDDGSLLSVVCRWKFAVPDVPEHSGVYAVSVDGGADVHFRVSQLRRPMWLRVS